MAYARHTACAGGHRAGRHGAAREGDIDRRCTSHAL